MADFVNLKKVEKKPPNKLVETLGDDGRGVGSI